MRLIFPLSRRVNSNYISINYSFNLVRAFITDRKVNIVNNTRRLIENGAKCCLSRVHVMRVGGRGRSEVALLRCCVAPRQTADNENVRPQKEAKFKWLSTNMSQIASPEWFSRNKKGKSEQRERERGRCKKHAKSVKKYINIRKEFRCTSRIAGDAHSS